MAEVAVSNWVNKETPCLCLSGILRPYLCLPVLTHWAQEMFGHREQGLKLCADFPSPRAGLAAIAAQSLTQRQQRPLWAPTSRDTLDIQQDGEPPEVLVIQELPL